MLSETKSRKAGKIQYCSDLHLEFQSNLNLLKQYPIVPIGDILILAGDIVPFAFIDKHKDFFRYVSDNFKTTYWLPGNHEYYYFDIAKKSGTIHEKIHSNVFLVNNIAIQQENVKLIFSTLWTKINPANEWEMERNISDFKLIKYNGFRFSVPVFNALHQECLNFIEQELKHRNNTQTIVITHHVPTFYNYPEQYKGSSLNEAFAVELYDFISTVPVPVSVGAENFLPLGVRAENFLPLQPTDPIPHQNPLPNYWIYGHHHVNVPEFTIGNTKMLTNQLGYVIHNEHHSFKNDKIINIDE